MHYLCLQDILSESIMNRLMDGDQNFRVKCLKITGRPEDNSVRSLCKLVMKCKELKKVSLNGLYERSNYFGTTLNLISDHPNLQVVSLVYSRPVLRSPKDWPVLEEATQDAFLNYVKLNKSNAVIDRQFFTQFARKSEDPKREENESDDAYERRQKKVKANFDIAIRHEGTINKLFTLPKVKEICADGRCRTVETLFEVLFAIKSNAGRLSRPDGQACRVGEVVSLSDRQDFRVAGVTKNGLNAPALIFDALQKCLDVLQKENLDLSRFRKVSKRRRLK